MTPTAANTIHFDSSRNAFDATIVCFSQLLSNTVDSRVNQYSSNLNGSLGLIVIYVRVYHTRHQLSEKRAQRVDIYQTACMHARMHACMLYVTVVYIWLPFFSFTFYTSNLSQKQFRPILVRCVRKILHWQ